MSLDCGLIGPDEMFPQLKLIARGQSGPNERKLQSGAIIPPYSIADHIRMDGLPVYYPGTYSAGENQGGGPWGPLPPADDHYYFVHIAWAYSHNTKDQSFLSETVEGLTILDRLIKAFNAQESSIRKLAPWWLNRRGVRWGLAFRIPSISWERCLLPPCCAGGRRSSWQICARRPEKIQRPRNSRRSPKRSPTISCRCLPIPQKDRRLASRFRFVIDFVPVDKGNNVGILFDGAGFAQVGHLRAPVGAVFDFAV